MTVKNEQGQSILEIVFVLPVLFVFVALLYKINMASQIAINNTQIARSQMFQSTANSPEYPRLQFRFTNGIAMHDEGHSRLVIGVADPSAASKSNAAGTSIMPVPQTQNVARKGTSVMGSTERGEVNSRTELRIRNTVAICTQFNTFGIPGKSLTADNILTFKSLRWPFGQEVCKYE